MSLGVLFSSYSLLPCRRAELARDWDWDRGGKHKTSLLEIAQGLWVLHRLPLEPSLIYIIMEEGPLVMSVYLKRPLWLLTFFSIFQCLEIHFFIFYFVWFVCLNIIFLSGCMFFSTAIGCLFVFKVGMFV